MSCSCDLIGSFFTSSSQTCSNNILSFSTTLSYATDDGSITASYIIALLMADLNNEKNTSLVIDGQSISISNDKPSSAVSPSICSSFTGIMIGLPFVGFSVAVALCGVIICAVLM